MGNRIIKIGLAAFAAGFLALSSPCLAADGAAEGAEFAPEVGIAHKSKDVSPSAIVMDEKGTIYVSWIEEEKEGASVYLSLSQDGGKSYGNAMRVNTVSDSPSGVHNSPSLALGRKGEIYIAWITPKPGGEFAGDIKFSRSADGGKTFSPAIRVNDSAGATSVGFESIAVSPDGKISMAWLDGREKGKGTSATYFAVSVDGGRSFGANLRLDANSCPCCRTALTAGPDGTIYAAWRKVFENDVREIVLSSSSDGGKSFSAPVIVGNDKWAISGCPHRGPSLGVGAGGALFATWYSEGDGLPKIFLGESTDGGKSFSKEEIKVQAGSFPDHPALAIINGKPVLAWEEVTPVVGRIMFMRHKGGVAQQFSQGPRKSGYPTIVCNAAVGFLAIGWSKDEMKITKTLVRTGR